MSTYDLLVIGTGSGNTFLDERFEQWRVAMVEREVFGGTCLNRGCIPSKMLVLPAHIIEDARDAARLGVDLRLDGVDWPGIRDRIFGRIDPIAAGGEQYRRGLPHIDVYRGTARFTGRHTVEVVETGETIVAERIVLAAGARPAIPPVPGLTDGPFHTSDTIMRIDRLPKRLIVLGGGFIAAELGHVFASFGSEVTIIHRGDRMLRHHDHEISARFTELAAARFDLRLATEVTRVHHHEGGVTLDLTIADGRGDTTVSGDTLLVTTGRVPNGGQLNVEATGVRLDEDGYVVTDDTLLAAPGIWALGDIRNPAQLKHLANHEAKVVGHNLAHPDSPVRIDERVVPSAVFTHPEIAMVGATEAELAATGRPYVVGRRDVGGVAYGWALEDTTGFAKVLVDPETGRILGAHLIGPQAATLIQQLTQAMTFGLSAEQVAREQIWCHPALPELLENALLDAVEQTTR